MRRKIVEGIAAYHLQRFDQAQSSLAEAERLATPAHPELQAEIDIARGTLSVMRGDRESAEGLYQHGLEVARQQHLLFVQGNALGSLGYVAMKRQRYGESIDFSGEALLVARELNNRTQVSKLLGNLGWCYYQLGDFDRALQNFSDAEKLTAEMGLARDQLSWLNNIGLIYYQQRDYTAADADYNRALEIARKLENKSAVAMILNNLAAAALERKKLDAAEKYNQESLSLLESIAAPKSDAYLLDSQLNQARIERERGNFSKATTTLEDVIRDSGENVSQRWEAESELAGVYARQDQTSKANALYQKALQTIDTVREKLGHEEYRLSFLGVATRFYNDYIDFLVSHGRAREALAVAEHSRARTLAEGLKVPVSQLSGAAFHPEENARKLNSVVLSYWLKPERSYLWVVTPTKVELFPLAGQDEIDANVQEYRKALLGPRPDTASAPGQKLYELLVSPAAKVLPSPCPTSAAVSRCGQSAPRIIVIADGSLLSLNFETLLVPTPEPHYWIEDATIANASSIALLGASSSRALPLSRSDRVGLLKPVFNPGSPKLLLIGDPVYTGTEFPKLTQAKTEIEKVEAYFSPQARSVIDGTNAKPSIYATEKPNQYNYIHFVAHGTASRVSPLDSGIVLSKEGDAYKLYARDIMAQPLRAELVTISACYGAGNRAYSGEGLVGLSWAFLRAGAHNVIAALWEVNDLSTPQLMDNLYSNVKKGQDPATALRAAKLAMLHSENVFRRPFYWGAFQLYIGS